jgi:uncharacterized protein (DUF1684 family)
MKYKEEIDRWHQRRVERLQSKTGWLSLAGLYWLEEGENTFGAAEANQIRFPEDKSPPFIGSFLLKDGQVRVKIKPGVPVEHDGVPVEEMEVMPDISGNPTILSLDSLSWFVIKRDQRYGIRLRDSENENLKHFNGIERFPVDSTWRIAAGFEKYDPPKPINIPTVLGTVSQETSPGALVFEIAGKTYRLDPTGDDQRKRLFLIFADQTNGIDTYGAGRFLSVDSTASDSIYILDFNKAYNPPCAFTPYATCPLPPQQNVLPVAVTAGEKKYGDH